MSNTPKEVITPERIALEKRVRRLEGMIEAAIVVLERRHPVFAGYVREIRKEADGK